jgi:uncharacterized membrane protein YvlD (DUF360 family)
MKFLKKFFIGWVINLLAIYITSAYIAGSIESFNFDYGTWQNLILVSLGFTIVALLIKPFVKLLALPFGVIGIFFFALANAAALYATQLFVPEFATGGSFRNTLIAGAAIGIINFFVHLIIR